MSRPLSLGYLTPPEDAIASTPWMVTPVGSSAIADPEVLENWQYATDLDVEKTVSVDLPKVLDSIGLGPDDELRILLVASTSKTGIQRSSEVLPLQNGENSLGLRLVGSDCGGAARLRILITSGAVSNTSRLAPRRAGSVLWSEEWRVFLEGDQSRFPTEIVSFANHPSAPAGAAWALEVDTSDLAAPAPGCVRLLLNSDHPVYSRLTSEPTSPEAVRTREFMRFDTARQLVSAAMTSEEFGPDEFEEGSLGAILRARLANYFGEDGDEVEPLRARWQASPWEIDAELQASFEL